MHLTLAQYLLVSSFVAIGAVAQGTVGFGLNLISAPVVGLIAPQLLPATMIVVGLPLSVAIALQGRHHIDWGGVGWTSLGRLPGTAVGAVVVAVVSVRALGGVVGVAVIVACAVASTSNGHVIGRANATAAGLASGFMDTAAATGGPPLALLYQHRPGPEVRSTLAASFISGTAMSVTGLFLGHKITSWQLLIALALIPSLVVGLGLSRLMATRLAGVSLRPAILTFAAVAGTAALIRALIG